MTQENVQVENVEIIPDFENEIVEETPAPPVQQKPCGCNKGKQKINNEQIQPSTNWMRIIMIVGGVIAVYFIFKKVSGKKVEMPKVEVPKA